MTLVEWLVKVNKKTLPLLLSTIKELNGGHIKIIKEEKNFITVAIAKNPEKISLPENIQRIRITDNHSRWELWQLRKGK